MEGSNTPAQLREEILKKNYEHHKNVVNPDDNWATWEKVQEDGTTALVYDAMEEYKNESVKELEGENKRLKFMEIVLRGENHKLRDDILQLKKENDVDPYSYYPQCDVEGCESVSCRGGGVWEETGYWSVCPEHSQEYREGKPQPKMKQSAIEREASRDKKTGFLPIIT